MRRYLPSLFILLVMFTSLILAQNEARLFRFPAIYDSQIVFTYAGDLYIVSANGGIARKLTSHKGYEMFARFSPDGKYIAFTAQYDGNTEVYVMPSEGGVPRRLTYTATLERDDVSDRMGPNNIVMCWTPDGKYIVFRSRMRSWNAFRENCTRFRLKEISLRNCRYQEVAFALFPQMGRNLLTTGSFVSSGPGKDTEVGWQMTFGFMTLKRKRPKI
jgi:tricorn protease